MDLLQTSQHGRLPSNVSENSLHTFHEMHLLTKTMAKLADMVKPLFPP